jgi:hypothetical protein
MLQQNPQQPRVNKPWHENINTEMRKHLVQKIIQTIFPTQDHNIYRDPRLSNLVNYAIKTECEMYEQANDQEEYFHLLAEKIYKIQKEFEEKQRMSRTITSMFSTLSMSEPSQIADSFIKVEAINNNAIGAVDVESSSSVNLDLTKTEALVIHFFLFLFLLITISLQYRYEFFFYIQL